MIRVLEVLASLRRAGAERVAVTVAGGLDAARFHAGVVSLYDAFPGGFEPMLEVRGVPVWHLGKRRGFDPRMWGRLARVFRDFQPDVVHTHSYVLRYVLPVWRGTLVHTVHNVAEREVDAIGRFIHRIAFRIGVVPVAISNEMARSFRALYGREPAAVIPNGIDTRRGFRAGARETWRAAYGFGTEDLLVASVARFEPQKNPLGLIEAFAGGLHTGHLIMAGEGSLLENARGLAVRLGVAGRVHFLGLCTDIAEMLSACDLFALASEWEGTPVAVLEAMAARLPVVATAVGGVPEMVEHGISGLLVPAGDESAFAHALAEVAADPERRRAMGEAGAWRVRQFDADVMVSAYGVLFERRHR